MSFFHELERRWPKGDRVALISGEARITFAELRDRALRAASLVRARGIGPGDVVAVQLPRAPSFLEVHLGCLAIGATTLPMNDRYTEAERDFLLRDAGARLALLPDDDAAPCPVIAAPALRALLDAAPALALPDPQPADAIAVLCYTSGTTGRPKGALISHRNLAATVEALHQAWRWSADDVLLHALPLYHVHGLFVAQHGALWAGARTVWLERFEPVAVLEAITRHRATVFMGVPTFYHRLLQAEGGADLSSMRLFTSGSAPLPADVHRAFAARFGFEILERYGMTEVGMALSNPLDGERRPGAVGFPLPGVQVKVVEPETGTTLEPGQVGELRVAGPSVFQGYLGRPEQTAAALTEGWMRTGDLGRVDEEGYFHVVGRITDLVLVGGLNVYPREVEAVLEAHPGVREAAVVGVPDPDLGERLVATVVAEAVGADELHAFAAARLAPYKRPRAIALASELPRNAMGKLQKDALRAAWSLPSVRPARIDEAEAIAARNRVMARETEGLALDPQTALAGARAVLERDVGARYFLAEIAGAVVGQCMITTEWSDWRAREVWWLQSVHVDAGWRQRGVYRALHEAVREGALAAGAAGLRLYVDRRNTRASEVYRRVGMDGDHYLVFEDLFDRSTEAARPDGD